MKTNILPTTRTTTLLHFTLILFAVHFCSGQIQSVTSNASVSSDYSVIQREPHSRLWQRTVIRTNSIGIVTTNDQSYTELATGICYLTNGQYADSVEEVDSVPGGAQAVQGRHQVQWALNANTPGGAVNVFLAAQGTYNGLFAPANAPRQQTNSGAITFTVTSAGVLSGKLTIGSSTPSLNGKFNPAGAVTITTTRKEQSSLTTTLQLDFSNQSVSGTVSDGAFTAELYGNRDVFTSAAKATNFEGQYTLIIPGANDPAVGPYGTSYGTVKVDDLGNITLAGGLADGTAISQSSVVSKDGTWPLYINLYGGNGSLWGSNYFINHALTNNSALSWINATNPSKTAVNRSGFTNQAATLTGGLYVASNVLPMALTVSLEGGDLSFAITNGVTVSLSDKITPTNSSVETNNLTLTITKSTGVISGSFANPAKPKQTIKINGVILQGQTNAQGYFLGTNQSGRLILDQP